MDANTPLWKAHDISQQLQDKIEVLPNVGRAFVHVDHETTHIPVSDLMTYSSLAHPFITGASETRLINVILLSSTATQRNKAHLHLSDNTLKCPLCPLIRVGIFV